MIYLRAQYPAIPVVVVSASDDSATIRRSLDFGASGFIPKRYGVETLRDAILKVMEGDVWVPSDIDLSSALATQSAREPNAIGPGRAPTGTASTSERCSRRAPPPMRA